jgi:hypothetical protein
MKRIALATAACVLMTGCGAREEHAGAPNGDIVANAILPAPETPAADRWIGRWTGPEGLFLDIAKGEGGAYRITNRHSLDATVTLEGRAVEDGIAFTREGREMIVRAGSGADTGFKWLADKTDCLIVRLGEEGYCRG